MRLAGHLGMPLRECMQKTTHREYMVWMEHLEQLEDETTPTQWYLMQIAHQVAVSTAFKKVKGLRISDFKLKWERDGEEPKQEYQETPARSKSRWKRMLGMK